MTARRWRRLIAAAGAALALAGAWAGLRAPAPLDPAAFAARYAQPLSPPAGSLATYHLGHSLVGRDMPAMLAQLAGHIHAVQLGWGASLADHRKPADRIPGHAAENAHPAYRPAAEALASGDYGAVVLTEMVEIRDAIRHHDSAANLAFWARAARAGNPGVRVYLYETWHRTDDPEGWLNRIDADLARHWQGDLLRPAMARDGVGTIHVIPAGQVLAAVVRAAEAGELPGLTSRRDLFARLPDGTPDPIHLNDLGAYVVALAHYATLYHRSPVGLPHRLMRADGSPADPLPEAAVAAVQAIVDRVVRGHAPSGVGPGA